MSLVIYLAVTLGFAAAAWLTRGRAVLSTLIGLAGLVAATVAAVAIRPGETLVIDGAELATSVFGRIYLVLGSVTSLGLVVAGLAGRTRPDLPAICLATLGISGLALGLTDYPAALAAATAAGLVGAMLAVTPGGDRAGATAGIRHIRAVVTAGALAVLVVAWVDPDMTALGLAPPAFGLAYLAVALGVAIRFGAIPFHLWAARLTDVIPDVGLPLATVLAAAPFAIVGLDWVSSAAAPLSGELDAERAIVLAVAIASIVLAALASLVQDDLEHVVGYSIVGDAGVAMLAVAALDPGAPAPARAWIIAMVVTRSAFAVWAGGVRYVAGTGRITELRGWGRHSPALLLALGLVVIASIGLPGFAAFEARASLVTMAVEEPFATPLLLGVLAPLAFYARLLAVGVARPDGPPIRDVEWRPRVRLPDLTAIRIWGTLTWETNRAFSGALAAMLLAALAVATSAGAFGTGAAG